MIIFLCGKDSFRSYQKLKEIIQKYQEKYPETLNFHKIDATQFDLDNFKSLLNQSPLFLEKKLVVFRRAFTLKVDSQKQLIEILKDRKIDKDENNVLVFWENDEVDKRTSLFKYLEKHAKTQEFSLLNQTQLRTWAKKIMDEHFPGLRLPNYLVNFVATNLGPDLWRIYHELQKLDLYQKSGPNRKITKENIEALVVFPVSADIFQTIDAVASKNKKAALKALASHFENLEPELKILAMFEYQFRSLVKIRSLMDEKKDYHSIQQKTKIHPYAFRKMFYLAQNFTMNELKNIYDKLFELDLGFKTGKIQDKKIALEMFVVGLCSS